MKTYLSLSIAPQVWAFFQSILHERMSLLLVSSSPMYLTSLRDFEKSLGLFRWNIVMILGTSLIKSMEAIRSKKNFVLILELQGWYIAIIIQGAESFHSGSEMAEYKATRRTNIR